MASSSGGIAFVPDTIAKTQYDHLPLPGELGRLGAVRDGDLVRILAGYRVPGVSAENGRMTNAQAYAAHIERIKSEGATRAVNEWLAAGRAC